MSREDTIELSTIAVVNKAITESHDLEIMCTHLTQLLVAGLGIKGCAIFILNPETEELESLASTGLSISYLNKGPVLSAKSIAETLTGKPIIVRDIEQSDRLQYPENARKEGIRAIVSFPIKFKGHVIGALRLYHREVWDLSSRDIDLLECLADNTGLAMTCSRLLNALQIVKETVTDIHAVWL